MLLLLRRLLLLLVLVLAAAACAAAPCMRTVATEGCTWATVLLPTLLLLLLAGVLDTAGRFLPDIRAATAERLVESEAAFSSVFLFVKPLWVPW